MSKLKSQVKRYYVYLIGLLAVGILFLVFLLFVEDPWLPVPAQLTARFHPLILHFPIVLVIVLSMFEGLQLMGLRLINEKAKAGLVILSLLSALVTIISGFLLYYSGGYSGELITKHFYGAIFSGVILFAGAIFYVLAIAGNGRLYIIYLFCLAGTFISILFTSHMGGSVTHGTDFLTEPLDRWRAAENAEIKPVEDMLLFQDVIMAFVDVKCVSCHNPNKKKGGLLLTNYQDFLKGGDSKKAAIRPFDSEESELWARVNLVPGHEDHMPPEGKTPFNHDEKEILKLWIESGASDTLHVGEVGNQFRTLLDNYIPQIKGHQTRKLRTQREFNMAIQDLAPLAFELGLDTEVYDVGIELLVSLAVRFPPEVIDDESLKQLSPYFNIIGKMSIAGSAITDDGAYLISKMRELRELYIQKTSITSQSLTYLQNLPELEILNLSDTKIDDPGVLELLDFPVLNTVYLGGNEISKPVLDAVRKVNPGIKFLVQEGPYF